MPVNPEVKVLEGKGGGNEGEETGSGERSDVIAFREVEMCCDEI